MRILEFEKNFKNLKVDIIDEVGLIIQGLEAGHIIHQVK